MTYFGALLSLYFFVNYSKAHPITDSCSSNSLRSASCSGSMGDPYAPERFQILIRPPPVTSRPPRGGPPGAAGAGLKHHWHPMAKLRPMDALHALLTSLRVEDFAVAAPALAVRLRLDLHHVLQEQTC